MKLHFFDIKIVVFATLFGLGAKYSYSQSSSPPDPQVSTPSESSNWEITISSLNDDRDPDLPTKIIVTKTPGSRKDEIFFENGKSMEYWAVDGQIITRYLSGEVAVDPADSPGASNEWVSKSYYGTDWIRGTHFKGTTKFETVEAHYYSREAPRAAMRDAAPTTEATGSTTEPASASRPDPDVVKHEAWIDTASRRPIRVMIGDLRFDYRFDLPPKDDLALPQHVQRSLSAWRKMRGQ